MAAEEARRHVAWGEPRYRGEACAGPDCYACAAGVGFADERNVALEALAATLAEPLRRAFQDHLNRHDDCGAGVAIMDCPEAARMWYLLPDGDRIVLA